MKILSLIYPKNGASKTLSSETGKDVALSLKDVLQVMENFPIGSRTQYFPEYRKEIKIDTIIVAYVLNDYVIYSNKDILISEAGKQAESVEILQKGTSVPLGRIFGFHLLIPYIARQELDLQIDRGKKEMKAEQPKEKDARDFRRGNSITLFCRNAKAQGIFNLDTEVKKNIVFNSGLYAKRKLVVLGPLLDSFECIDIRRFNRINTEIPADIILEKNKVKGECLIQDFSDRFVRVELPQENRIMKHAAKEGDSVMFRIACNGGTEVMVLKGSIFRTRENFLVVALENIMANGRFKSIEELDELYIKATMLAHPNTDRT
ncbi:MAG: hypothetical protein KJ950_12435 [Proteobacteria bacterium]|nr:hypothetical protein [Pseudomonadota bacterium]MBU1687587.1 hypothetical protein [Pseudomonadota bacterium]